MDGRAGSPNLVAAREEDRRILVAAGVAFALHLLLMASSGWTRHPTLTRVELASEAIAVQVDEEAPAPSTPGGGDSPPNPPDPREPPVRMRAPKPKREPAEPPRADKLLAAPIGKDEAPDEVESASGQPSAPTPTPVPSNSRANQRLGRGGLGDGSGIGPGGLFGNGAFAGKGPGAWQARVCFIPESTRFVSQVRQCDTIYEQFLDEINIPVRRFEAGFPGFEDRTEWFSVTISGGFNVTESGNYQFRLKSDDGSQLFVDNQLVIDNDGIHSAISKRGKIDLAEGRHRLLVRYFQGMKFELALQLFVTPPGESERLFTSGM